MKHSEIKQGNEYTYQVGKYKFRAICIEIDHQAHNSGFNSYFKVAYFRIYCNVHPGTVLYDRKEHSFSENILGEYTCNSII